jgi:hypothetical protein
VLPYRRRDIEQVLSEVQAAIKKASWAFNVPDFPDPKPTARKGDGARDAAIWMAVRDHHIASGQQGYL